MTTMYVDFQTRRRVDPDREDDYSTPTVTHFGWCRPDECVTTFEGAAIHKRMIGQVADVTVTVESMIGETYREPASVRVHGDGEMGLTDEQTVILADLLGEARRFVQGLPVGVVAL